MVFGRYLVFRDLEPWEVSVLGIVTLYLGTWTHRRAGL